MRREAEAIVIGGGVHGTSVAFNLLAQGLRDVLVLEKESVGAGATGRSASFVRHHYSNEICVRLVQLSRRILLDFEEEVGQPVDFQAQPLLLLAGPEHEKALRENVAMHRSLGVDVDLLPVEDSQQRFPFLDHGGLALTALERDAGYGDAYQLNVAYADGVRRLGGTIQTGTEAQSLIVRGGAVRGVQTLLGEIQSRCVVLATGPWAGGPGVAASLKLPVSPALLSLGVLQPAQEVRRAPMAFDMTTATYWRPERNGTLLVGTDEEVEGSYDPDRLPGDVPFDFAVTLSHRLGRRWPAMREARFIRGWVGADGATPDLHPIIGEASEEGLYLSVGYSGHGFKFSPGVGRCLAELILDGRYRTLDLSPFRLGRFAAGETFRSRYPMAVVQ